MTQIHPETRSQTSGEGGLRPEGAEASQQVQPAAAVVAPQASTGQPHSEPASDDEPTAPVWFGETREIRREPSASEASPAASPAFAGPPAFAGEHPAYIPPSQPPAGPPPPVFPREGAEPAQPANRRRWTELTAVAVLAALLASGGTYAATRLGADSQLSSSASSATLGRGTNAGPVVQADANTPNWTVTAAAVAPSVVSITVQSGQAEAQGSGVVIDAKGHILTNNHVVTGVGQDARITVTLTGGRTYPATVTGTDPSTDLAVITLTSPPPTLTPIALGDSSKLKVGEPVMAVGNPLGLAGTVTTGIVSALNRPVSTQESSQGQQDPTNPFGQSQGTDSSTVVTNAIQTSAAINPGNSGGALVNASGQLVGINSSIATLGSSSSGQSGSIGIGFAIPVNEVKTIASQLISKGTADHAFLGVTPQDGTASDGSSQRAGAVIAEISAGTPAAAAGLKKGDVVVGVDDEPVDSALSLVASIRERSVGEKVTLKVLRQGKELTLKATLVAKATAAK